MEKWADIPGYEGWYQISDQGNVRSLDRVVEQGSRYGHIVLRSLKGEAIAPFDNGNGYMVVGLRKNQIRKNYYVHRLVAEAFVPNSKMLPEINHIDYNRSNNRAENLEWVSRVENIAYSAPRMRGPRENARLPKSGHKYIQIKNGKYRLSIHLDGIRHEKTYTTLQQALDEREVIMRDWQHFAGKQGMLRNWSGESA